MSEIVYRNADASDAPLLEQLFRESFTDTFGHLYKARDLLAFLSQLDVAGWTRELTDPAIAVRVAEQDGGPMGFAKIGPVSVPVSPARPALELRQLYILPAWKGRGVAAALMDRALAAMRARGAEEIYLSVYADNPRAQAFYRRYGFVEVGAYHFMVGDHADDERIMRRLPVVGKQGG